MHNYDNAIFAGGCFWCLDEIFAHTNGVVETKVGYTGGYLYNPSYEKVCFGHTGHYEAVKVVFDKNQISYERLLEVFWKNIDPTNRDGQFCDVGKQYETAIFCLNDRQRLLAQKSKERLEKSKIFKNKIVTEILDADKFYEAENYHQDYYKKCPIHYSEYKKFSGRKAFEKQTWPLNSCFRLFPEKQEYWVGYKKPETETLKRILTPQQFYVMYKNATERAFDNEYADNKEDGIYVDRISGEPLFCSMDKFDSNTGWPSFTQPLEHENIVELADFSYSMERIEVRSRYADSHLGHLFKNEPTSTGLRYCINSASLRFIEKNSLMSCGYGYYLNLFP